MAFTIPTVSDLVKRIRADIAARITSLSPDVRKDNLQAFCAAEAGVVSELYKFVRWATRQMFPDTADQENLERWGSIVGLSRISSVKASGSVTASGTNGSAITTGIYLQSNRGFRYIVTIGGVISSGTASITIEAVNGGSDCNLVVGDTVSFESTPYGIDSDITITSAIDNGSDVETDNAYRSRILYRLQNPARGGSEADYVNWAKEASSKVTRVWPYSYEDDTTITNGSINVYFMADDSGVTNGIPSNALVSTVSQYLLSVKPVGVTVTAFAPTAHAVDIDISISPNTAAVQSAVTTQLKACMQEQTYPNCTLFTTKISEYISAASGLKNFTLNSPSSNVVEADYKIPTLGTITFHTL